MRALLSQPWISSVTSIYCSTEQKAIDGAVILADHLSLEYTRVEALGENDRTSTGFLPPDKFEATADAFFANPDASVLGWERAIDAQARIVRAVTDIAKADKTAGSVAIVSHGAVGALLYCHLTGQAISRRWDQPGNGGGNYYTFTLPSGEVHSGWKAGDVPTPHA